MVTKKWKTSAISVTRRPDDFVMRLLNRNCMLMEKGYSFSGLFWTNFALTLGVGMTDAFFSTYLFSLGGRGLLLAGPFALYSLAKICFSPLLGRWSDQVGRRLSITVSLCLYLLVPIGFLLTGNLIVLAGLRLVQGIACALLRPVLLSLVGESCAAQNRSKVMGTFDSSFYAALSLGPVLGGMIRDDWGFAGLFTAFAVLSGVALVCFRGSFSAGYSDRLVTREGTRQVGRPAGAHKHLYGLYAFIYARACGISLLAVFLPIFLSADLGLDATGSGLIMASGSGVMALALRPLGSLADHTSRYTMLAIGGSVVPLLYCFIPHAGAFEQILVLTVLIGLFSSLSQPAVSALLIEQSHRGETAQNAGTFTAVLNIGFFCGPLIGAALEAWLGLTAVFYAAGGIGLLSVPISIALSRHHMCTERCLLIEQPGSEFGR